MTIHYRHYWNVTPEEAIAIQNQLADLTTSIEMVMCCTSQFRLAVPIRAAHDAAGQYGTQEVQADGHADNE